MSVAIIATGDERIIAKSYKHSSDAFEVISYLYR